MVASSKDKRYRSLARVIDTDVVKGADPNGVYVVFPGWNFRYAVYIDSLPEGFTKDTELPFRCYATIKMNTDHPGELDPKWCK